MSSEPRPVSDQTDAEVLEEKARHEAQERVAQLHKEEGTVQSEGAQNSPQTEDLDP